MPGHEFVRLPIAGAGFTFEGTHNFRGHPATVIRAGLWHRTFITYPAIQPARIEGKKARDRREFTERIDVGPGAVLDKGDVPVSPRNNVRDLSIHRSSKHGSGTKGQS